MHVVRSAINRGLKVWGSLAGEAPELGLLLDNQRVQAAWAPYIIGVVDGTSESRKAENTAMVVAHSNGDMFSQSTLCFSSLKRVGMRALESGGADRQRARVLVTSVLPGIAINLNEQPALINLATGDTDYEILAMGDKVSPRVLIERHVDRLRAEERHAWVPQRMEHHQAGEHYLELLGSLGFVSSGGDVPVLAEDPSAPWEQ